MANEHKTKFWTRVCWLLVIVVIILYFVVTKGTEEGSTGARIGVFSILVDVILIIFAYSNYKKAKAASLNMTLDQYNEKAKEEVERKKEEWKEAKKPKINIEGRVICPSCGSTNIQIVKRGWKMTTGFIGSGKNERVCVNCMKKF